MDIFQMRSSGDTYDPREAPTPLNVFQARPSSDLLEETDCEDISLCRAVQEGITVADWLMDRHGEKVHGVVDARNWLLMFFPNGERRVDIEELLTFASSYYSPETEFPFRRYIEHFAVEDLLVRAFISNTNLLPEDDPRWIGHSNALYTVTTQPGGNA